MYTLKAKVVARQDLNSEMLQLTLRPERPLSFLAGQYCFFYLNGVAYPYSIASAPFETELEFHIQHSQRHPITPALWSAFQTQNEWMLSAAKGLAYFREKLDLPIIFVAGGGGFSQIQSMLKVALVQNKSLPIDLYWGVCDASLLYRDALCLAWCKQYPHFHYHPTVQGFVHEAVLRDFQRLDEVAIYCAGPFALSYAARRAFIQRGALENLIFSDAFEFKS